MNKTELKNLIRKILVESEIAADKAHKMGLHHTSKGVWANKSGQKVAVTSGDNLIKYTGEPEQPQDKAVQRYRTGGQAQPPQAQPPQAQAYPGDVPAKREPGDIQRQMQKYQTVGREAPPQPSRQPVQVPAGQTAQDALAQRKARQQIAKPSGEKLDVRVVNPEWYNNLEFDLEEEHGIPPEDISPDVMNSLYQQKMTAEEAAVEYLKIKDDVKQIKADACKRMSTAENIKRLVADEFALWKKRTGA